jgi:hypothetical protein
MSAEPTTLSRSLRSVGWLLLAIGAIVLWISFVGPARGAHAAKGWTAIPCHMVSIEKTLRKGRRSHTRFDLEVVYEYTIGERTYQSSRYRFGGQVAEPEISQALASFSSAKSTTCWVNPDDPTEAVLIQGFSPKRADVALGALFLLVGGGLVTVARFLSHRAAAPPGS